MRLSIVFALIALVILAAGAAAQDTVAKKPEALVDRVTVVLEPGAAKNQAVAVISATNVNPARVLSFPLKYDAGETAIKFDSITYAGSRVEHFKTKAHTLFPDRNAVLIMMLAPYVDNKCMDLTPGYGEIARIHFSSKSDFPLTAFQIGPVKLPPENKLLYVTDTFVGVEPAFDFKAAGK